MSESNGNGRFNILITIALALFSVIIFPVIFFLGKEVIANERNNVGEHTDIRECISSKIEDINKNITPMKEDIAAIKMYFKIPDYKK